MSTLPQVEDHAISLPYSPGSLVAIRGEASATQRLKLLQRFSAIMETNHDLNRQLVSYQGNRAAPGIRWLKYREGFSTKLVQHLFSEAGWKQNQRILDPFSGVGTTALVASLHGEGTGIELMPIGISVTKTIAALSSMRECDLIELQVEVKRCFAKTSQQQHHFPHVAITKHAFSDQTERDIGCYRDLQSSASGVVKDVLRTVALSVLEEVSFTRKDGQYLRWDKRSGRTKASLDKGELSTFPKAVSSRFNQLIDDLPKMHEVCRPANINLIQGSSLERLPLLPSDYFDGVVTSPPYANRYDYTRTYALELAYCGYTHDDIKTLRQTLLSATVENRSKVASIHEIYTGLGRSADFDRIVRRVKSCNALTEVVNCLHQAGSRGDLSNRNVIGLVENYFFEMAFVIAELSRVTKVGGKVFMVNDNVQYAGEEVPVDLILADIAEQSGFVVEKIWMLAKGKGNASQQMGRYGRREIRKCVYVWKRRNNEHVV